MHIYMKGGCDVNDAQERDITANLVHDICIPPGSEMYFYGGGMEFFPLKGRDDIRIHAFLAFNDIKRNMKLNFATNTLTPTDIHGVFYQVNFGITWRLNFINR